MPQEEEEDVVAAGAGTAAVTPTPASNSAILPATSGSPNPSAASSVVGAVFGEDLSLNKLLGGANFDHLAELNNIPFSTVYSEDQQQHTQPDAQTVPEAKKACSKEDSLRRTWVLKFVNCQVRNFLPSPYFIIELIQESKTLIALVSSEILFYTRGHIWLSLRFC